MKDVLFFDKMLTPKIITFVYWLLIFSAVIGGMFSTLGRFGGFSIGSFFMGIVITAAGILAARIWCELLIVLFKMNEALQELRPKQED